MTFKIQSTKDTGKTNINILVYGQSGVGKTRLISTLPSPLIISAESGLLTLKESNIDYIAIDNTSDIKDIYRWLKSSKEPQEKYKSIAFDSLSEIAEIILVTEKEKDKSANTWSGYLPMQEQIQKIVRAFRDLPYYIYFTSKAEKALEQELGRMLYQPAMPGNKLASSLPYFFDFVFAMRIEKDSEGKEHRLLQCQPDNAWQAKSRDDSLSKWEQPHLGNIIKKVLGANENE